MNITDLTVPGVWRCPKCQFTQVNQTLAPDGIGADTRPHLFPCPNDGRDMVPVTWREHAADLEKMLQTALDNQCNEVISRVEYIRGGMAPDTVLVTMATGQVLQIGLEGVNLYETRGCLELCAEPVGGLVFER